MAAALLVGLSVSPALAQSDDQPKRPAQQVSIEGSYVFDGQSSLRAGMKQIYNKKDGPSVYFGEDFGFFHSTCGSNAFCNNIGGRDSDLRLGVEVMPDTFIALGSGTFAGNGASLTGLGIGLERLARGEKPFEITASLFWYPSENGTYSCPLKTVPCYPFATSTSIEYAVTRYALGGNYAIKDKPLYVTFGFAGDTGTPSVSSAVTPYTFSHSGAYLGLGFRM